MSLAEQASFLLDILPSIRSRKNPENFSNLDQTIGASLPGAALIAAEVTAPTTEVTPFAMASRMSRSHFENQAKADALTQALRKIRASHASKAALIRTPG